MTMMQHQNQRGGSTSEAPAGTNRTGDDASWIDPVCGMNVKRLSAFFTAEHGGATYRFCSESCRGDFEEDPARFTRSATPADEH